MHTLIRAALVVLLVAHGLAADRKHTIIALSHSDHTVYELDPGSGKITAQLKLTNQPHEGAVTPDGRTIFASVPSDAYVSIVDAATFKEKGRIETPFFRRTPQPRPPAPDGTPRPPNTSASPHSTALNTDGSKLYIGVEQADVPGVVVYDVAAGKVLKKIDLLLHGGHFMAIQPVTDKLYYPHDADN